MEPGPVPRKTHPELVDLARDIVTNVVYAAWDDEMFNNSFSMVFLLAGEDLDKEWLESIGLVYEEFSKANERAVNGHPTFFSFKVLHRDDKPLLLLEMIRMGVALGTYTQKDLREAEEQFDDLLRKTPESQKLDPKSPEAAWARDRLSVAEYQSIVQQPEGDTSARTD